MGNERITLRVPTRSTPGYLRRRIAVSEINAELEELSSATPENPISARRWAEVWNRMADIIAEFVTVSDGSDPRAALLELSEEEFNGAFAALKGSTSADPLASGATPEKRDA